MGMINREDMLELTRRMTQSKETALPVLQELIWTRRAILTVPLTSIF